VNQCTSPSDRLLLLSYSPEILYFSGRLFAGGVASLVIAGNTPANDEFVLSRMQAQSVPIVVGEPEQTQFLDGTASNYFPQLHRYLRETYRLAGTLGSGHSLVRILVSRNRTANGVFATTELPCFR
jgi:hypothetical protein